MKTKIEIKSIFGEILFTYDNENATIKDALEQAVKENANLIYADLSNANLSNADLSNANLIYADLSNANLIYADLSNANLYNADLRHADLSNANLYNADLSNADLSNANLSNADLYNADLKKVIKMPIFCKWSHGITGGDLIHIGCEKRTIKEWDDFFKSNAKLTTERGTDEFKQIEAVYLAYNAYLTHLSK